MPEYFIALVKQIGNFASNDEANIVVQNITKGLFFTLTDDQKKLFFTYTPKYISVKSNIFYELVKPNNHIYRHQILIDRIMKSQNLTDESEVNHCIKAYFSALAVVVDDKTYQHILTILPEEIKYLVINQ